MKLFNTDSYGNVSSPTPAFFVTIIAIVVGLFLFFTSFFTVSPGERAFVVTFGSIGTEVYDSGFHFKNPLANTVKMNVQTDKFEIKTNAGSKDSQPIESIIAVVNWNVLPSAVRDIKKNYGDRESFRDNVLLNAFNSAIKTSTAKFTADECLTKRDSVETLILETLQKKLDGKGIYISSVNISDLNFSKSYNEAIDRKAAAIQNAQTAKNDLAKFEYIGQQAVVTAEAEKKAAIAKAQGIAEAIRIQAEAIKANGGAEYIELRKIEAWEKGGSKVPQIITSSTPLLNIPSLK